MSETLRPNRDWRSQMAHAFGLLQKGQALAALELVQASLSEQPGNAELLYAATEASLASGLLEVALDYATAATVSAPGQLPLLLKQADILVSLRRRNEAKRVAEEAAALAFGADELRSIGRLFRTCSGPVEAAGYYAASLRVRADNPAVLYELAAMKFFTGDVPGAEADLKQCLALSPQAGHALYLQATLRKQTEDQNHLAVLRSQLASGFADPRARAACLYALAKELEDLGRWTESFSALTQAATTKRATLRYDAASEVEAINAIGAAYSAGVMQVPDPCCRETGAIFIVGMPRTGTTLLERMLDRHSQVESAGELLDFSQAVATALAVSTAANPGLSPAQASLRMDFAALGSDYMRGAREAAHGSACFVDKMPINFMYCGMIAKALPGARIIHVTRDPMDSIYAIYKTLFNQSYHFSYDLNELTGYYIAYHQLMQHWHEVMPGRILDVAYESFIHDPEAQARRVLDWCGLSWEDRTVDPLASQSPSMTASAVQARAPVHRDSLHKWRHHESELGAVRERLMKAGIPTA